jgi:DinB superfamily
MNVMAQTAAHLRQVYFGGNWTASNFKEQLADINWQEAVTKVYDFNTIATLTYHTGYYVSAVLKVLQGERLEAKDSYSFEHPPIKSQDDWDSLLNTTWANAESFASLIEQLPDSKLGETFFAEKYGNYYRNLNGIIEHLHYHLGQIALIKKIIRHKQDG